MHGHQHARPVSRTQLRCFQRQKRPLPPFTACEGTDCRHVKRDNALFLGGGFIRCLDHAFVPEPRLCCFVDRVVAHGQMGRRPTVHDTDTARPFVPVQHVKNAVVWGAWTTQSHQAEQVCVCVDAVDQWLLKLAERPKLLKACIHVRQLAIE